MSKKKIVLPADVYDTLELSALALGGIGADFWFAGDDEIAGIPFCVGGHADFTGIFDKSCVPFASAFPDHNYVAPNNKAVHAINTRKGRRSSETRVSWREYTRELNIVRADS